MGKYHRFKVGQFDCITLSDGEMNYPVPTMFKNMPLEAAQEQLAARGLPREHVYSPYSILLIDTGSSKILVDTGLGRHTTGIKSAFNPVDNSRSRAGIAVESLAEAGISAGDIDTIILTHAHPDHVGGNFDEQGRPCYPNARYIICRREWEFWFSDDQIAAMPVRARFVEMARADLEPLKNEIILADGDEPIVPGVTLVPTPGHTPGHLCVLVESDGQRLMNISDAVLLPIHLELPEVVAVFDIFPQQSVATRRRLCDQLADDGTLVFAHHFAPYPNLGRIEKLGEGWHWCPDI